MQVQSINLKILVRLFFFQLLFYSNPGPCESLTPSSRVEIVEQLKESLLQRYSLWDLKIKNSFNFDQHFESCFDSVSKINDGPFLRLEFSDQVKKCISGINDTHLRVLDLTPTPELYLGFSIHQFNDRFVISAINPQWVEYLKQNGFPDINSQLQLGKTIESWEGESPLTALNHIKEYLSGSSEPYLKAKALQSLTQRNFLFPQKNYVEIKMEGSPQSLRLPWWSFGVNLRADTRLLFKNLDIKNFNRVDSQFTDAFYGPENLNQKGWTSKSFLANEKINKFYEAKGPLGLISGLINREGVNSCYLKIMTFNSKTWTLKAGGAVANLDFEEPFRSQLKLCTSQKWPLVLDLRHNPGGDSDLVQKLYSLLRKPDELIIPRVLFSARLTDYITQIINQYTLGDNFPEGNLETSQEARKLAALQEAQSKNLNYLPFIADNLPKTNYANNFTGDIITLIGPECTSACEIMVQLLKKSNRSITIGEPTTGTGVGFNQNDFGSSSTEFRDDIHGTLRVLIPNSFFAVLPRNLNPNEVFIPFEIHSDLVTEGKPIRPDIAYSTQMNDLLFDGLGWLTQLKKWLPEKALDNSPK